MSDYDAEAVVAAGPQKPGSIDLCPNCRGAWHGLPWLGCAGSHEGAALPPQIDAEAVSDPETSVGPIPTYETRQRAAQPDLADSYQWVGTAGMVRDLLAEVKRQTEKAETWHEEYVANLRDQAKSGPLREAQAWAEWFAAERDWIRRNYVDDLAATYVWQQNVEATIERVRMLHSKRPIAPGCMACDEPHPCATIRALDGES